jgi:methyltransferase (TIGR00027 family)
MIGSAFWVAAVRARESARPDRLFDDPWAAALAGERGVSMMAASERATGGENAFLPVRVRYFDDAITAAVADGVRQVVLLGAGLDTRPYRLDLPADLCWYEIDRPEIFDVKDPVLASATVSCERLPVPVDLSGDWAGALRGAGFDADRRTVWIAEGLLFYLSAAAVDALLREMAAACGPDSLVVADVMSAAGLIRPQMAAYLKYCAANGVPPPFGHDDPASLFTANGWNIDRLTFAGAPDANYGRFVARAPAPACTPPQRAHLVTGRRAPTLRR